MYAALLRYGAIVASTLAFTLYARVDLPWTYLGLVGLVPWLASLEREPGLGAAAANGVVMAMAFTVGVFAWFAEAIAVYTGIAPLAAYGLLVLAAPALQPQFVVYAVARHHLAGSGRVVAATAAACAWVGTEWLWPHLLGDTIGQGLFPFRALRQGADLAGTAGLTLVVLLVNECTLAAIVEWRSPRRSLAAIAAAAGLLALLAGYGAIRLRQASGPGSRRVLVGVAVQAGLADYDDLRARLGTYEAVRRILGAYLELSTAALAAEAGPGGVDLVVWPETVYPTTFGVPKSEAGARFDAEIVRFARDSGVPLLFGTYDRAGDGEYNAAVLLQGRSDPMEQEVYRKRRPFPLTEWVPAWLDSATLRAWLPWLGTWRPGDGPPLLTLRRRGGDDLRIAPLICLDAVDPGLAIDAARRGADVVVSLSNDGWFARGRGARLHLVVSAFRSIETRLPQLRVTNTGISAVIDATGEIVARTDRLRSVTLTGRLRPGRRMQTPVVRFGGWLGPAAWVVVLLAVGLARLRPTPT